MNYFLTEILKERGDLSSMRLMSLFSLFMGALIACYGIYENKDLTGTAALVSIFVVAAFGGKIGQKITENKTLPGE